MIPLKKAILVLLLPILLFSCNEESFEETNATTCNYSKIPNDKQIEIEILEEINRYRLSKNLNPIKKLNIIKSQTYNHTLYMIEKNELSHDNFSDRSSFLRHKLEALKVGENAARGYSTAKSLVQGWIDSEPHRMTMLDDYTHFNISARQNEHGIWFYDNIFVRKQ